MLEANLMDGFELIEVKCVSRANGAIRISNDKKVMNISAKYIKELGWKNKERVNLKGKGGTFALEPCKTGLVTVHVNSSGGGAITSVNFCIEVLSRTRSCREYEGWTEGDVLFFRPKRGEE